MCYFCGKKNHIGKVCQSKLGKSANNSFPKISKTEYRNDKRENSNNYKQYSFKNGALKMQNFQIQSNKIERVAPLQIDALIEGKKITFEVDTVASVSVCSQDLYEKNLAFCKLLPNDVFLTSYTNEPIVSVGKVNVNVQYENVNARLDLYVVKKGSHPLMGRNWLKVLGVGISFKTDVTIQQSSKLLAQIEHFDQIVNKLENVFSEVFSGKLGQYKGDPVELKLKENAIPKYFKPRPIPFSLKSKVEKELERLQNEEILVPVTSADWGTPIVPVLKKSGEIRICGDFKVTLNPFLEVEKYPLPRIEELFASLQGGVTFSKIDLSQAYMQLELSDEAKKLCTISTHKGLFMYQRMPFGISSGPSIFQKVIEKTLQGLEGVAVFLDDILVTAKDTKTHLSRLQEVLKRLRGKGFAVEKRKCKFFSRKLEYLGFCIDKEGLHTSQSKVEAIVKAPVPKTVTWKKKRKKKKKLWLLCLV